MKKFSDLSVGEEFFSECTINNDDLEKYLAFSGIRNVVYEREEFSGNDGRMVSGRAILSRMEGQFTRLEEMYGNLLIFYGVDGDPQWNNRQTRFLRPVKTGERLKIRFKISGKKDLNSEFGLVAVDFEGMGEDGKTVVISKRNLYQMKKDPPK